MLNYIYNNTNHKVHLCVVLLFQQNFIEYILIEDRGLVWFIQYAKYRRSSCKIAEILGTRWYLHL